MKNQAGIWIDHQKAVVVILKDDEETILHFASESDSHASAPGEKRVKNYYTRNDFVAEDRLQRKAAAHTQKFYDEVIHALADIESMLILGPGEAKGEFTKRLEALHVKGRVSSVEAADKMTDPQVAAHIRKYFSHQPETEQGSPKNEVGTSHE